VPGRDPEYHRADLKDPWEGVRAAARLEGVTIHDLRRTFGLHVARKAGLHIASKLLRHSDIRVTERVSAPLGIDDLRNVST
jgi:integrase